MTMAVTYYYTIAEGPQIPHHRRHFGNPGYNDTIWTLVCRVWRHQLSSRHLATITRAPSTRVFAWLSTLFRHWTGRRRSGRYGTWRESQRACPCCVATRQVWASVCSGSQRKPETKFWIREPLQYIHKDAANLPTVLHDGRGPKFGY